MSATVIEVAEAVVAAINGATLSQAVTAARDYAPILDIKDLAALRVTVIPSEARTPVRDLQGRQGFEWTVGVWIQKRAGLSVAEADPLVTLAEEIALLFRPWRAHPGRQLIDLRAQILPAVHPWHVQGVFTTVVMLTVRVSR